MRSPEHTAEHFYRNKIITVKIEPEKPGNIIVFPLSVASCQKSIPNIDAIFFYRTGGSGWIFRSGA